MNSYYSTALDSFASSVFLPTWDTSYYTDTDGQLQEMKIGPEARMDHFDKGPSRQEGFFALTRLSSETSPHFLLAPALTLSGTNAFQEPTETEVTADALSIVLPRETLPSSDFLKSLTDAVTLRVRKHLRLNLRHTSRHQVLHFWDLGSLFLETLRDHPEVTRDDLIRTVTQAIQASGNGIDGDEKKNYESENLDQMIRFALCFRNRALIERLAIKVRWPHFKEILALEDPMAREFYAELCWQHNWRHESRLIEEIEHTMWERSALSRQSPDVIQQTFDSVRRGIIPEIFNLKDVYYFGYVTSAKKLDEIEDERELEDLIVSNVSRMINEIGVGIDYAGHQVDLKVDKTDGHVVTYHIDILLKFWNGASYRGVIIELKTVPFKSDHFGQIDGYTDIYNEKLRRHGESDPIRLILVPAKNDSLLQIMERGTGKPNFYVSLLRVTHDEVEWHDLLREAMGHSEDRAQEDRALLARLERSRE